MTWLALVHNPFHASVEFHFTFVCPNLQRVFPLHLSLYFEAIARNKSLNSLVFIDQFILHNGYVYMVNVLITASMFVWHGQTFVVLFTWYLALFILFAKRCDVLAFKIGSLQAFLHTQTCSPVLGYIVSFCRSHTSGELWTVFMLIALYNMDIMCVIDGWKHWNGHTSGTFTNINVHDANKLWLFCSSIFRTHVWAYISGERWLFFLNGYAEC